MLKRTTFFISYFFLFFTHHWIPCKSVDPAPAPGETDQKSDSNAADAGNGENENKADGGNSTTNTTEIPKRRIPLLQYEIELEEERSVNPSFQFETVDTKVDFEWDSLPQLEEATLSEQIGLISCKCKLELKLINYKNDKLFTICFYQDTTWGKLVECSRARQKHDIYFGGSEFESMDSLAERIQPLKGFIVGEFNSVAKGYLIDGSFYGHLRSYDIRRSYHINYYIEPADNADLYGGKSSEPILFENVGFNPEDRPNIVTDDAEEEGEPPSPPKRKVGQGKVISKREVSYRPHSSSRKRKKRHKRKWRIVGDRHKRLYSDEDSEENESKKGVVAHDIYETLPLEPTLVAHRMFDTSSLKSFTLHACIWIQPNFAENFGLGGGESHGLAEVFNLLFTADWLLRAVDFNGDYIAENFGLKIKNMLISDEINVNKGWKKRKRRSVRRQEAPTPDFDYYEDWGGRKQKWKRADNENQKDSNANSNKNFSTEVIVIPAKDAYRKILKQVQSNSHFDECGMVIGFLYHNMGRTTSVSTLRGLCSKTNLVLVSGLYEGRKMGVYDVLRSLLHGIGHLIGASHEDIRHLDCFDSKTKRFINPMIMHLDHQVNVGARPNSFRFSSCTKTEALLFLMSKPVQKCLEEGQGEQEFCGNGMTEKDEECDCASIWQCEENMCCGESDTVFACKNLRPGRRELCPRPTLW